MKKLLLLVLLFATTVHAQWFTGAEVGSSRSEAVTFYDQIMISSNVSPWRLKQVSSDPSLVATYGNIGDLASHSPSGLYQKVLTSASDTNWKKLILSEDLKADDGIDLTEKDGGVYVNAHDFNLIPNYSFERFTGLSPDGGWSGTALDTIVDLTQTGSGDAKYLHLSFTGGDTYSSSPVAVYDASEYKGACVGYVEYAGSDSNVKMLFQSATPNGAFQTLSEVVLADVPDITDSEIATFKCPPSQDRVRVQMEASATGEMSWFKSYIKPDHRVNFVESQPFLKGLNRWATSANCIWQRSIEAFGNYSADADCDNNARTVLGADNTTDGSIGATDGQSPLIRLKDVRPGIYKFIATGRFVDNGGTQICKWRFTDGTNSSNPNAMFPSTSDGNILGTINITEYSSESVFQIQAGASGAGENCDINNDSSGTSGQGFEIAVYYYPPEGKLLTVAEKTQNWYAEYVAVHSAGNSPNFSTGTNQLQAIANTYGSISPTGSNNATCYQVCDAADSVTAGTNCAGNENIGLACDLPAAGDYEVCMQHPMSCNFGAGGNCVSNFNIIKTENTTNTVIERGSNKVTTIANAGASGENSVVSGKVCERFDIKTVGKHTFKFEHNLTGGSLVWALSDGTGGSRTDHRGNMSIKLVTKSLRPPAIVELSEGCTIYDLKSNGTDGGTFTSGAWRTRDLLTLEGRCDFLSLSGNQITPESGLYKVWAAAPARKVGIHVARLRNVTTSITEIIGQQSESNVGDAITTASFVVGSFTANGTDSFELQHRGSSSQATNGFGAAASFGQDEIYSVIHIDKVR